MRRKLQRIVAVGAECGEALLLFLSLLGTCLGLGPEALARNSGPHVMVTSTSRPSRIGKTATRKQEQARPGQLRQRGPHRLCRAASSPALSAPSSPHKTASARFYRSCPLLPSNLKPVIAIQSHILPTLQPFTSSKNTHTVAMATLHCKLIFRLSPPSS